MCYSNTYYTIGGREICSDVQHFVLTCGLGGVILDVDKSITDGGPFAELLGDLESAGVTHLTDKLMAELVGNPDECARLAPSK